MNREYFEEARKLINFLQEKIELGELLIIDIPVEQLRNQIETIYCCAPAENKEKAIIVNSLFDRAIIYSDKECLMLVLRLIDCDLTDIIAKVDYEDKIKEQKLYHLKRERILNSQIFYWRNLERNYEAYKEMKSSASMHFSGKGVIYTAITGGYDDISEPEFIDDEFDYVLFTDNKNIKSNVWKVVYLENEYKLDNARLARYVKIMGHIFLENYDYSVWVDGKIRIIGPTSDYIAKYQMNEPILCFNHYSHENLYEEVVACVQLNKYNRDEIINQFESYQKEGLPSDIGMIDSAILVRELHNPLVMKLMSAWWEEVKNKTSRDQLSFNYACWKTGVKYDTSDIYIYDNEYFTIKKHTNI